MLVLFSERLVPLKLRLMLEQQLVNASPSAYTLYRDGATQDGWTKSDGGAPNPEDVTYSHAAPKGIDLEAGLALMDGDSVVPLEL